MPFLLHRVHRKSVLRGLRRGAALLHLYADDVGGPDGVIVQKPYRVTYVVSCVQCHVFFICDSMVGRMSASLASSPYSPMSRSTTCLSWSKAAKRSGERMGMLLNGVSLRFILSVVIFHPQLLVCIGHLEGDGLSVFRVVRVVDRFYVVYHARD